MNNHNSHIHPIYPKKNRYFEFFGHHSGLDWNTEINNFDMKLNRYCYSYDGMNRLTGASYMVYYPLAGMGFNNQENYSTSYNYDLNSNLTALQRYGKSDEFTIEVIDDITFDDYGLIDNLSITRDGNLLKKVTDQCEELTYAGAMDFKDGANKQVEYTWDANGNMTSDKNKGLTQIKYNVLNLPEKIIHSDGHVTYITYAADDRKLNVTYKIDLRHAIVGPGGLTGLDGNEYGLNGGGVVDPVHPGLDPIYTDFERVVMTRDYCGNYIYRNGAIERIMMGNVNAMKYCYSMLDEKPLTIKSVYDIDTRSRLIDQVKRYNQFFIDLCDNVTKDEFGIDNKVFKIFCNVVGDDIDNYLTAGINSYLKGRYQGDEHIEDVPFFYPIIGIIRHNLLKNLCNEVISMTT